jgi:hypothetical protein
MASVCAYLFEDRWLIHPEQKSFSGFFVAGPPYQTLPFDVDAILLGGAVRRALEVAQTQIPDPTDWKAILAPRLAAAGVKTEASFQRSSRLVSIVQSESKLVLRPSRNGGIAGIDKGFHVLEGSGLTIQLNCSNEALGRALNEALCNCI